MVYLQRDLLRPQSTNIVYESFGTRTQIFISDAYVFEPIKLKILCPWTNFCFQGGMYRTFTSYFASSTRKKRYQARQKYINYNEATLGFEPKPTGHEAAMLKPITPSRIYFIFYLYNYNFFINLIKIVNTIFETWIRTKRLELLRNFIHSCLKGDCLPNFNTFADRS